MPSNSRAGSAPGADREAEFEAVARLEEVAREALDRVAAGGLDVALGPLADVLGLRDRAQVAVPVLLRGGLRLEQLGLEAAGAGCGGLLRWKGAVGFGWGRHLGCLGLPDGALPRPSDGRERANSGKSGA